MIFPWGLPYSCSQSTAGARVLWWPDWLDILHSFFTYVPGIRAGMGGTASMQTLHVLALNKHGNLLGGNWVPPEWASLEAQMEAARFIVIYPWKSSSIISAVFYWPKIRSQGQSRLKAWVWSWESRIFWGGPSTETSYHPPCQVLAISDFWGGSSLKT